MTRPDVGRRRANPVRLTVARELGQDIDGAWWPRTPRIADELPDLVAVLETRLGEVIDINVNWSQLSRPPDLNWLGWHHKRQHIITIKARDAHVNVLVIPHTTNGALAMMVLRRAASLPIDPAHIDTPPFMTAGSIVRAAQQQCAAELHK